MNTLEPKARYVGRVWRPDHAGPAVVTLRAGQIVDITSRAYPTVRDILEQDDPVGVLDQLDGEILGSLETLLESSHQVALQSDGSLDSLHLLAPCDLQVVKACGVTFARSMIERIIEERASGDPSRAREIRDKVSAAIGDSLHEVRPGSEQAQLVKATLIAEGLWSQYLEVGIGPDAEVFSKAQVLSSVGYGARIGLHPSSLWNNPEPEIVLAVSSAGKIVGASLGNDVNLRDIEGRSALLLSKAKDNNASCAIGPFIRLFDQGYSLDDVRRAELHLTVKGRDGFVLNGRSSMSEISRDPEDLVAQTIGRHHQYPDGLMLFLGTLFAPVEDRDVVGEGFTHKIDDEVEISCVGLGALKNTVDLSTKCPPWVFGVRALMVNLSGRGLI